MECLKTNLMRKLDLAQDYTYPCIEPSGRLWMRRRRLTYSHSSYTSSQDFPRYFSMIYPSQSFLYGHKSSRTFAIPINVGVEPSSLSEEKNTNGANEIMLEDTSEVGSPRKLTSDELKALLLDSERKKLMQKLSEANQNNRFFKRQLLVEEDALTKYKNELAVLELELQALVGLAEEVANSGIPLDSRKINGKYIQSHLLARLEVVHEKVKEQIKDVDLLRFEEVELFWVGMAESVQVKGSFDGWTKGEEMSPEYSGNCARFSATLKLRPGRYEIKFLVDGEWQLSTELPTVGEGLMQNNLLVVTS
ncbi:protein PTST, chloroplastic-like isoform X1 [Zingiber officinale]|uniref:protein PTST, chloroplastic-like isoform X1 n=2 Tax=Zingiber officinale TaxID=94328 RepID=UPI001C4B5046|nr:protein PTST, chloroplastic-like isoform X1 [Zingiber officinale]XP_042408291.1 protein PTST, chloroplastic-like isoform X1 [Zingiber officinale]